MKKEYEIKYMGFPGLPLAMQLTEFLGRVDASRLMTAREKADYAQLKVCQVTEWVGAAREYWRRANNPNFNPCLRRASLASVLTCFAKVGLNVTSARDCALIDEDVTPKKIRELRATLEQKAAEYVQKFTVQRGLGRIYQLQIPAGASSLVM